MPDPQGNLDEALRVLREEIIKALRIDRLVNWLSRRLAHQRSHGA